MAKSKTGKRTPAAKRLARYRARAARRGLRRIEVGVPSGDVTCIRKVARTFRNGGPAADSLRHQIETSAGRHFKRPKTGADLMEMSRRIIGEGVDLELPPREYYPENDEPVFGR